MASIELPTRDQGDATPFDLNAESETQEVALKVVDARRLPRDRQQLSAEAAVTVTLRAPEDGIGDKEIVSDMIGGARLKENILVDVPLIRSIVTTKTASVNVLESPEQCFATTELLDAQRVVMLKVPAVNDFAVRLDGILQRMIVTLEEPETGPFVRT